MDPFHARSREDTNCWRRAIFPVKFAAMKRRQCGAVPLFGFLRELDMADELSLGPSGILTGLDQRPRQRPLFGEGVRIGARGAKDAPAAPKSAPRPAGTGDELNIVGKYKKPASWTPEIERKRAFSNTSGSFKAMKWAPMLEDFRGVALPASETVATDWDFLLKIVRKSEPIRRLNFFAHANSRIIAMSGEWRDLDPDGGGDIFFSASADDRWEERANVSTPDPFEILAPYSVTWGRDGTNDLATKVVDGTNFSLADVRKKFATDAQIWLYMCHVGATAGLLQMIADTFRVTVRGFTMPVSYITPTNFPASRRHSLNVVDDNAVIPEDPRSGAVADFHLLDTNRYAVTVAPRRPFPPAKPKIPAP